MSGRPTVTAASGAAALLRRPRRAVVVFAGAEVASDRSARVLERSLCELGIEVTYIGRETDPDEIALAVVAERADTVELCLEEGMGGVMLLRALLRRLIELGRRDVSIVVHRAR